MLERETDPAEWTIVSPNDGANYLINRAPVDELLTRFHAKLDEPPNIERIEFYKTVLMGRYTDAQMKALDRLTTTLNDASGKSSFLTWALIAVTLGTWALFCLEIYKIFWAK